MIPLVIIIFKLLLFIHLILIFFYFLFFIQSYLKIIFLVIQNISTIQNISIIKNISIEFWYQKSVFFHNSTA